MPMLTEARYTSDEATCAATNKALLAVHDTIMLEDRHAVAIGEFGLSTFIYQRSETTAEDVRMLIESAFTFWRNLAIKEGHDPATLPASIAGIRPLRRLSAVA